MKKIYSLLLTAAALLVGTNAWAATRTAKDANEFKNAWEAAANGDVIKLTNDVTIDKTLWLGTANMKDAAKSITLDLNSWTLMNSANDLAYMFVITHGSLNITGNGIISQTGSKAEEVFRLTGSTYETVNPKTATSGYFSSLTVGEGVQINAAKNGIVLDEIENVTFGTNGKNGNDKAYYVHADKAWATAGVEAVSTKPYSTRVFTGSRGIANGVRVDVSGKIVAGKYAMKANGNLGGPSNTLKDDLSGYYISPEEEDLYSSFDAAYAPFIHIHSSADLRAPAENEGTKKPVAVYCSGFARWLVEGTCVGSTGIYVKSGEVDIHDANIQSNYTGEYTAASSTNSGVTATGSAVVIESSKVYAGDIDVNISGDSHLSAGSGYAIDESITYGEEYQEGESKVNTITISGGTFDGGGQGVMTVCAQTALEAASTTDETTITIIGGQASQGSATVGDQTLADFLASSSTEEQQGQTHITYVDNTMVISQGSGPSVSTNWADIETLSDKDNPVDVKWETIEDVPMDGNAIYLGELLINSGSAGNLQKLTIPENKTLQVKNLIMNSYARIIVEAGGKLIVTGEQGIVAPNKENILLKHNSATNTFASLLLDPAAVSSNKHPNATVEFTSQSWRIDSDHLQWEWFGIPTYTAITSITATCPAFVAAFENSAWSNVGLVSDINGDATKRAKMNKPFVAYDLLANRPKTSDAPKITISGEMVGNVNAVLNVNYHWTPVANSYTAEIDAEALVNVLKNSSNITDAIYVARHNSETGKLTWDTKPADELNGLKLKPMQAFLLNNPNYMEDITVNYASMVYAPATASAAPRRSAANEYAAKVTINVANEDGTWDNVDLRENSNAKSYEKYLNDDVNIYVLDGEKNDYVVAEDLENAYVGFSTVEGGNFTISFTKAEGREFDMIDLETGAKVAVAEGETYSFTAAANYANDYRFKLVERAKMPTAIENTEVKANVKGIYTITGQYLGEMNVWNTLPAGIYVVNGTKLVK